MKKLYQHVFQRGSRWTFRCQLPGLPFQSEEDFDSAADAAYHKDLFFLFLIRKFSIPANLLKPSLPHPVLLSMLREVGLDTHNLSDLFMSLPTSCREFIQDGCGESILETLEERKTAKGFGDL